MAVIFSRAGGDDRRGLWGGFCVFQLTLPFEELMIYK